MNAQPCLDLDFVRSQFPAFAEPSLQGQALVLIQQSDDLGAGVGAAGILEEQPAQGAAVTTATRPRLRPVNGWIVRTSAWGNT
jgi:hypothetical protein